MTIMTSLVCILMLLSGMLFILSVLLMSPKGGLGFGVGGMSTSNEYGSKKSIETTLKKSAIISVVIFTVCAILYPYMAKHQLSSVNEVIRQQLQNQNDQNNQSLLSGIQIQDQDGNVVTGVSVEPVQSDDTILTGESPVIDTNVNGVVDDESSLTGN